MEDWTLLVIVAVVVGSLNGEYTNVFMMKAKDYVVPSVVREPGTEDATWTQFREHCIDITTLDVTHVNCLSEREKMLELYDTTV